MDNNNENFVFFLCPKTRGRSVKQRFFVNQAGTGLETIYESGLPPHSLERARRAVQFSKERHCVVTAIFSAADSLILYPVALLPPPTPRVEGVSVISNYDLVLLELPLWAQFYRDQPWLHLPQKEKWAVKKEEKRLRRLFGSIKKKNLVNDILRRIFAGYALDGVLLRSSAFGDDPILLSVESSGVAVIQNCMLSPGEKIPVIQIV